VCAEKSHDRFGVADKGAYNRKLNKDTARFRIDRAVARAVLMASARVIAPPSRSILKL
jgi:hypothetical protein